MLHDLTTDTQAYDPGPSRARVVCVCVCFFCFCFFFGGGGGILYAGSAQHLGPICILFNSPVTHARTHTHTLKSE